MEGYLAEIRGFAANFSPRNWQYCNGQLLAISSNQALFSLIGTIYGGDGRTSFALPDLRGRSPINSGGNSTGPGLSNYRLGQRGGTESVYITTNQLPSHTHSMALNARKEQGDKINPNTKVLASDANSPTYSTGAVDVDMASSSITVYNAGTGSGTYIRNPLLGINMVICTSGIFPSRN